MGNPIGKHKDGSNCYTRNCSLDHASHQYQISSLQNQISAAFDNSVVSGSQPKSGQVFRSLEYGTPEYKFFRDKADESEMSMTSSEYKAISEYTGWAFKHYYSYIEGKHSNGEVFGSGMDDDLKNQLTSVLDKGLNNIDTFIARSGKFPKPVKVFRGEKPPRNVDLADHIANTFPVGQTIDVKRYMSTSMDAKIASEITGDNVNGYMVVIETREGAMLGENISEQGLREKEVLLPRDRKYEVVDVSDSTVQWGSTKKKHLTVHLRMVD